MSRFEVVWAGGVGRKALYISRCSGSTRDFTLTIVDLLEDKCISIELTKWHIEEMIKNLREALKCEG